METVERIMSRDLLTAAPDERLQDAAKRMVGRRVGAILVLEGDRLAGILTERDVLRAVGNGLDPGALVSQWMTRAPETVEPSATAEEALALMHQGGFRHLPVTDGDTLVGIVSVRDVLRVGVQDASPRGV